MLFQCSFLFHGNLNDFLSKSYKEQWIAYTVKSPSSVKDAIEAIGVPHVEVASVEVDGKQTNINGLLQASDKLHVFPYENCFPETAPKSFVLDVHLGKLARLLRMLGIDSLYQNDLVDPEIVSLAMNQQRTVLTRDVGLLKYKVLQHGYWLRSQDPEKQVAEVMKRFSLCSSIYPFSRCIACNGKIYKVEKEEIIDLLPPQTMKYFHEFYQCYDCHKVYWKGQHYENMQQLIQRIKLLSC